MAKAKIEKSEEIKSEEIETEDLAEAEKLQKSGCLLLSISLTPNGKKYKFKREK